MKIFTKFFLPVFLIATCFTGYGASAAFGVTGEGVYVPKTPSAAQENVTVWLGKSGSRYVSQEFKQAFARTGLGKDLFKGIAFKGIFMPKRSSYNNTTANASSTSMLGINMINTTQTWDEGRIKPTLSAYPNPTKGLIKIKLVQTGNETYKINFSNTIGQVLKTIKVPESARDSEIKLDLSEYPAGVYFYSLLVNDKMVETKRLILQQ